MDNQKKEANAKINEILEEVYAKLGEAEKIAVENKVSFGFEVAYGMGGWFDGETPADELEDSWGGKTEERWQASSQSC